MTTGNLTPVDYDGGGNPQYDEPPIHHDELPENADGHWEPQWWECPNCGDELDLYPGPDDGPDTLYRCENCSYTYAD